MARPVLLVGASATGKTTLGEAVARSSSIAYVYASTEKFSFLREGETLNLLGQERTHEVNAALFAKLDARPDEILVDTHAAYPYGDGFVTLTPPSACRRLAGIVLLEADAATVRERRIARGRTDEATDVRVIERELVAERREVKRMIRDHALPVCVLETSRVSVERAVTEVVAFVGRLPRASDPPLAQRY